MMGILHLLESARAFPDEHRSNITNLAMKILQRAPTIFFHGDLYSN